jgi:bacteriophage N4 adsorption protein B
VSLLVLSVWPWVLGTLATILLLSGLDDLVPSLICFWHVAIRRRRAVLCEEPRHERRIAIFVPCWKESGVIANMVRHNLAAVRYANYDFFLGVYPNDTATFQVVRQLSATFHNVHIAACPHPGPTSKADCLNWVYQRMLLHESEHGDYFDTIVLHDAEDLIHPEALSVINRERGRNAMVQVPVLPLPTPLSEFTHGTYCDDFAEYQTIDMRARQFCQSFVPSNGVGTGFARHVLEQLARERGNLVFDPSSLTEDYEIGVYIYNAGFCQTFVPLTPASQGLIATREYFPRRVRSAIRQRTRWVTGIGLQSWARDGWRGSWLCKYWFWRDRKGLFTNPLSLLTNMLFIAGLADWIQAFIQHRPWLFGVSSPGVVALCWIMSAMQCGRLTMRMCYTGRIFGLTFALGVPLRQFHLNFINCFASLGALWQYANARWHKRPLVWLKTDHAYPHVAVLAPLGKDLSEVLVSSGYLTEEMMRSAQTEMRSDAFLAQFLLTRGMVSEEEICKAISRQSGMPFSHVEAARTKARVARILPLHVEKRFGVIPFNVKAGRLFVAGARVPPLSFYEELKSFTRLPVDFHLVTKRNYEELKELL